MPKGNSFKNSFFSYGLGNRVVTGDVYFVDSGATGASNGNDGLTPQSPCATWDGAINKCTASNGDYIILLPGHSETIATASAVSADVAGVTTVGIGRGASRPSFNLTSTASTIAISGAGNSVENILITGGVDAIVATIIVSAADCVIKDVTVRDVTGQMTDSITTTAAADRLTIEGLRHEGAAGAGGESAVQIVGGEGITIKDFWIDGNFGTAAIENVSTASTNLSIYGSAPCYVRSRNAAVVAITLVATSTGNVGPNIFARLLTDAANITEAFVGADMQFFQPIAICNADGEVGMNTNISATTDAII